MFPPTLSLSLSLFLCPSLPLVSFFPPYFLPFHQYEIIMIWSSRRERHIATHQRNKTTVMRGSVLILSKCITLSWLKWIQDSQLTLFLSLSIYLSISLSHILQTTTLANVCEKPTVNPIRECYLFYLSCPPRCCHCPFRHHRRRLHRRRRHQLNQSAYDQLPFITNCAHATNHHPKSTRIRPSYDDAIDSRLN